MPEREPQDIVMDPRERVEEMLRLGDGPGALAWLRSETGRRPDDPDLRLLLAERLLVAGEKLQGLEELRSLAGLHLQDGRLLDAIAVQKRILAEGAGFLEGVRAAAQRPESLPAPTAGRTSVPVTPLFGDLEPAEMEGVVRALLLHHVESGRVVVREGEPGDSLFVVVSGALGVTTCVGSEDVELAILRAGDFFGEVALLAGGRRSATVKALLASELLEMRRDVYEEVVRHFPRVRQVMERFCRDRAGKTVEALRRHRTGG